MPYDRKKNTMTSVLLDKGTVAEIDRLVQGGRYRSRSYAIAEITKQSLGKIRSGGNRIEAGEEEMENKKAVSP